MPRKKKTNKTVSGFLFFAIALFVIILMSRGESEIESPVEQTPIEVIEEKVEEAEVKLDSVKKATIDRLKEQVLMIEQEEVVVPAEGPAVEEPVAEPAVEETPADTTKTEETTPETQEGDETDAK